MNEQKKSINPQRIKTIIFALLVLLPFALYLSMSVPVLSYVLYGLLLVVFGAIVIAN
jgi:hypothetical protein